MAPTDTTKLARINPGLGPAIDGVDYEGVTYMKADEPHRVPAAALTTRDVNTLPIFIEVEEAGEYGDMKVAELRVALADRGIEAVAGARKAELVAALESFDQGDVMALDQHEPASEDPSSDEG